MQLLEQLNRHAAERPHLPAVHEHTGVGVGTSLTWAQLAERARMVSDALRREPDGPAILPLLAARTPETVAVLLGGLAAGWTVAPLDPRARGMQIAALLRHRRSVQGVVDGSGVAALVSAEEVGGRWWTSQRQGWPAPHSAAAARPAPSRILEPAPWERPPTSAHRPDPPRRTSPEPAGVCLLTSGSTGDPKGVLVDRDDLSRRAQSEAEAFALEPADVLLGLLPLSFDVGLNQLLSAIHAGATTVLHRSWLPADLVRAIAELGVTGISGVPAVWSAVLASGLRLAPTSGRRTLRYVTVSGGDMDPRQLEALVRATGGAAVHKTYGQTETFRTTWLWPDELAARPRSVGRAYPGATFRVVREDGSPSRPGETGEVVHAGLGTMLGYLDGSGEPRRGLLPGDASAPAIATGDLGEVDLDGYLVLHGRRDAMAKIHGHRVYPEQVATALRQCDGVAAAEVVAVEIEPGDGRLVGFVRPGGPFLDVPALRRQLSALLPSYMVPVRIEVWRRLPLTATGKADLAVLRTAATKLLTP